MMKMPLAGGEVHGYHLFITHPVDRTFLAGYTQNKGDPAISPDRQDVISLALRRAAQRRAGKIVITTITVMLKDVPLCTLLYSTLLLLLLLLLICEPSRGTYRCSGSSFPSGRGAEGAPAMPGARGLFAHSG